MTGSPALGPPQRWDHARAALLALVLAAHAVYALPLPPALSRSRVKEPTFQRDVDVWVSLGAAVGFRPSRERVADWMIEATGGLHKAHTWLKTPFAPVMDLVGADQAWALFASTTTTPDRLEVAVRGGRTEEWRVVMRRLDPCCSWREPSLEYRRIRGVWDGQRDTPRPAWKGLTKWIAARAFEDFPDAAEVRVRLVRETLSLPGEPADDAVTIKHERVHRRKVDR